MNAEVKEYLARLVGAQAEDNRAIRFQRLGLDPPKRVEFPGRIAELVVPAELDPKRPPPAPVEPVPTKASNRWLAALLAGLGGAAAATGGTLLYNAATKPDAPVVAPERVDELQWLRERGYDRVPEAE